MSIPLGPYTPTLNQQLVISFPFQPDRVQAVLIANVTPYFLQVGGLPGVTNIWHMAWKEDIYYSSDTNPFTSALTLYPTIAQTNIAPFSTFNTLFVTIFEVGEEVPGTYPVLHGEYPSILNESVVKLSNSAVSGEDLSGGQAGTLTITPDAGAYVAIQGFAVTVDALSSGTKVMDVTLTVGNLNTLHWRLTETTSGTQFNQDFGSGLQSTQLGTAATLSIPAVSGGFKWAASMWGFEVFSNK